MFCYKCGTAMPDTSVVCPQCATPVQAPSPVATAGTAAAAQPAPALASPPAGPQASSGVNPNPWPVVAQPPVYTAAPQTDGKAIGSLILGILAIFPLWILAGIPAIILGHISRSAIRNSTGRLKGEGMAMAGLILGYVSVVWTVLIMAAIIIPNLVRARLQANQSAAVSTVRTINTSEVVYSTQYPQAGYASSLDALGPGQATQCREGTAQHACLIDATLGCSATAGWCVKYGYRFHINPVCGSSGCTDYVVTATPVDQNTGSKSFCSTSEAVIRSRRTLLAEPMQSPQDCAGWEPL